MNRWARLDGVVDVEGLRRKHVLVAGLGSGGSTVALELAKAGVGRFTLVDPDQLQPPNVIRHECDERYLGWSKVDAVAELIRARNPDAEIEAVAADVFTLGSRLEGWVGAADVVAGCTDTEPPKRLLNRLCLAAGVAAVYAGVYARGVGGEVIRCAGGPGDGCYACAMSVLRESAPLPRDEEQRDYGAPREGGVQGLGLDVRLIALLHAKVCLLTLLGRGAELPGDVLLFGAEAVDGLFPRPFASAVISIARQESCLVCRPFREAAFDLVGGQDVYPVRFERKEVTNHGNADD